MHVWHRRMANQFTFYKANHSFIGPVLPVRGFRSIWSSMKQQLSLYPSVYSPVSTRKLLLAFYISIISLPCWTVWFLGVSWKQCLRVLKKPMLRVCFLYSEHRLLTARKSCGGLLYSPLSVMCHCILALILQPNNCPSLADKYKAYFFFYWKRSSCSYVLGFFSITNIFTGITTGNVFSTLVSWSLVTELGNYRKCLWSGQQKQERL